MAFCSKCGANINDEKYCPVCGAKTGRVDIREKMEDFKDIIANEQQKITVDEYDVQNNKGFAILSYLGILCLVPIFGAKNSKFARFHAGQGFNLFLFEILSYVLISILIKIPLIGIFFDWVFMIVMFVDFCLSIYGIFNVLKGRVKALPIIGKFRIIK